MNLNFRKAEISDAPFVALVMMEAVGMSIMEEGRVPENFLIDICRRTDTLYSYTNATIVEFEGRIIGGLISYPGEGYHDIKVHTFNLVKDYVDFDVEKMDDETKEGEYYLDSAAVLPEYRGKGFGRRIIEYGLTKARNMRLVPVLACDPENKNAYNLYKSLGFEHEGNLYIFGEDYLRMIVK
jgi:hypothetical protein